LVPMLLAPCQHTLMMIGNKRQVGRCFPAVLLGLDRELIGHT
jgi:hypothetical protein